MFPVIVLFPFWTCNFKRIDTCAWGKELLTVNKEAKIFPHQQQSKLCEAFCIIFHYTTINKKNKTLIQFLASVHPNIEREIRKSRNTVFGAFFICSEGSNAYFINNYNSLTKFKLWPWSFLSKERLYPIHKIYILKWN